MPRVLPLPNAMNALITDRDRFNELMSIINSKYLPFAALGEPYFQPIIDWRIALVARLAEEVKSTRNQQPAEASIDWWKQEYILWFGFGQVVKDQIRRMYAVHEQVCNLPPLTIAKTLRATFVDYFLHLCSREPRLHKRIQKEVAERSQGTPEPEKTVRALIELFGEKVIACAVKDIFLPTGRRILNDALLLFPCMDSICRVPDSRTFNEKSRREWIVYVANCADYFNAAIRGPQFLPRLREVCEWLSTHKVPTAIHAKELQGYLESAPELNKLILNPHFPKTLDYDAAKQLHLQQHSLAHLSNRQKRNYGFW